MQKLEERNSGGEIKRVKVSKLKKILGRVQRFWRLRNYDRGRSDKELRMKIRRHVYNLIDEGFTLYRIQEALSQIVDEIEEDYKSKGL